MQEKYNFIELQIYLEKPSSLRDLIGVFSAINNQFERYLKNEQPNLQGQTELYVQEIRKGSIIVELIPIIAPLIQTLDAALIVDGFVYRYGGLLKKYASGEKEDSSSSSDLKDFVKALAPVAHDPDGKAIISSAEYHETKTTKRVSFEFDTLEAKSANQQITQQIIDMDTPVYETLKNVLMVFFQSNIKETGTGAKTHEKVTIESVSHTPMALIYATELAKERIKFEMLTDDGNIYKKGFFVDVIIERYKGKIVAYRVTEVRDIIELPSYDTNE